jgi:hypothetical protein
MRNALWCLCAVCIPAAIFVVCITVLDRSLSLIREPQGFGPVTSQPRAPRTAVVNVDNRELSSEFDSAGYWTLSAVNNAAYARRMGYEYIYLQPSALSDAAVLQAMKSGRELCEFPGALLMGAESLGPRSPEEEAALRRSDDGKRDAVQAVHLGRGAHRAASWAKLPALWSIAAEYDTILFLDSDAFVLRDVPFEAALVGAPLLYGHDARTASFVMMGNRPFWREEMPCAGAFLWRPAGPGRDLLRRWWDGSGYDRKHAYEQDALWDILDGAGFRLEPLRDRVCAPARLNRSSVAVAGTRQFLLDPSQPVEQHMNESWILHLGHGATAGRRVPEMRASLARRGITDARSFAAAATAIRVKRVDCLAEAISMHAESCAEVLRCKCCSAGNWWQ